MPEEFNVTRNTPNLAFNRKAKQCPELVDACKRLSEVVSSVR